MTEDVGATLPLTRPISVNGMYQNRSAKGRRGRMYTERYRVWKRNAENVLMSAGPRPTFSRPVEISLTVSEASVSSQADTDNVAKAYLDLFVSMGILPDDTRKTVRRLAIEWTSEPEGYARITPTNR